MSRLALITFQSGSFLLAVIAWLILSSFVGGFHRNCMCCTLR